MASLLFLHAHPDDETLWTGGTIAALAAAGHRVTVVTATDGAMQALSPAGAPRVAELRAAAAVLGAEQVVCLGYADSGKGPVLYPDPPDRPRFARVAVDEAAEQVAALLRAVDADVLVHYDAAGGYGHPDHLRIHQVGRQAASLSGVPTVAEATAPRELLRRAQRVAGRLRTSPYSAGEVASAGTPRSDIDTVIRIGDHLDRKLTALACHSSVVGGPSRTGRLTAAMLRCPRMLLRPMLGREWYRTAAGSPDVLRRAATGGHATRR